MATQMRNPAQVCRVPKRAPPGDHDKQIADLHGLQEEVLCNDKQDRLIRVERSRNVFEVHEQAQRLGAAALICAMLMRCRCGPQRFASCHPATNPFAKSRNDRWNTMANRTMATKKQTFQYLVCHFTICGICLSPQAG